MESKEQSKNREILRRWLFCLETLDFSLGSKYACAVPDTVYGLLEDAREELLSLFYYYEGVSYDTKDGCA